MRRFFKWLGYAFLGLIAAGVILYVEPFLNTHAYQDGCSFGSVSNEEYRALLAEAEKLDKHEWVKLSPEAIYLRQEKSLDSSVQLAKLVAERLNSVILQQASVDQQRAAIHAVLRSSGFIFRRQVKAQLRTADPEHDRSVRLVYLLDVNRIGVFLPIRRWAVVNLSVELTSDGEGSKISVVDFGGNPLHLETGYPRDAGRLIVRADTPTFFDRYVGRVGVYFGKYGCPSVPSAQEAG